MKEKAKRNWIAVIILVLIYIVSVVCLFWFQPFVASAKEEETTTKKVPGGNGNTVHIYEKILDNYHGTFSVKDRTIKANENVEIVGYIRTFDSTGEQYIILSLLCDGKLASGSVESYLSDSVGVVMNYDKKGQLNSSSTISIDSILSNVYYYAPPGLNSGTVCNITGLKIFKDKETFEAYLGNGSLDGMIRDIDDGEYDKEIGYLHDLKHHALMYGEELENGLYSSYDDRFTWSDYYPEYDDSYLVEVRASCEVEVKKWFGIGKSTVYNSNIRELARDVKYKDLEFIISLADERNTFSDFLNQYMPDTSSVSGVISAATYQFDAYYFRIYKWDEEAETYKYGLWVRLTKNGSALTGSLDETIDAGDFDDDGNFKPDPGSDYGPGKPGVTVPGVGDDQGGAKDDADKNQEDREDENKQIDLSNTNFKELWEWFTGLLLTFWNGLGVIPDFFGRIFSFLPSPVIGAIGFAIVAAIILRIIGR